MSDTFYTVEIPHQRPAEVTEWPSKDEAVLYYLHHWSANSSYDDAEPTTEDEIFEWAGHDLHSFRTCDSLEELLQWAISYANHGGHQRHRVLTQVEDLCEEAQS